MDRRMFLRRAAGKGAELAIQEADRRVRARVRWIRPPFAADELDFLLACTRCTACLDACPYGVIFPLPARLGTRLLNTPALDLANKGCRLCSDWPCVAACETGALARPERSEEVLPALGRARLDTTRCLPYSGPECGACRDSCPVTGAMVWESERPRIVVERCIGCGLCRETCIVEPRAIEITARVAPDADRELS